MKRLILLVVSVMILGSGAYAKFCDKVDESYFLVQKDNFGNISKKRVNRDVAAIQLYIRNIKKSDKKIKNTAVYFGEIVGNFLVKHPKDLEKWYMEPGVYTYAFNSGAVSTMINMGKLPAKLDIQNVHLQTKQNTISSSFSIYNLSNAIIKYIYSNKNKENTVDRFLLMANYLQMYVRDGNFKIVLACNDFNKSDFAALLLMNISKNIKQKKIIILSRLLLSKDGDAIDKYLLSNKKVNNLYKISKKAYTDFLKAK